MKYFVAGSTARIAADLLGIYRNSGIRFFHKLREKIASKQQHRSEAFSGEIELDESYFGGTRKGKRGRGAAGKAAVFGILKHEGEVHTQIILDVKSKTLMPIIRCKIRPDSIAYIDYGHSIMLWILLNLSITELIIVSCLHKNRTTSMGSKTFGIK